MPTFTVETIGVTDVCPGDTVLAGGVPEKITRVAEIDATANNLLMMGKSTRIRLYSRKELIAEVPLSTTVCRLVKDVVCVPEADIEYLRDAHHKITAKSPAPERALAAAVWEFLHAAGAEDKGSKAEDEEETEKDEKE
ncbi:hypothetical protein [Actinomyces oris]|uniref:hypothetical protein n=1 Tax=Actinomyces oris TaxID=544580 RepID=UPI0028D1D80A|nr:hypothetical protein [Actinomyces oris]